PERLFAVTLRRVDRVRAPAFELFVQEAPGLRFVGRSARGLLRAPLGGAEPRRRDVALRNARRAGARSEAQRREERDRDAGHCRALQICTTQSAALDVREVAWKAFVELRGTMNNRRLVSSPTGTPAPSRNWAWTSRCTSSSVTFRIGTVTCRRLSAVRTGCGVSSSM